MKKNLLLLVFSCLLSNCSVNPNKEARIQKLEDEISSSTAQIKEIENRVRLLEIENEELKTKIDVLE